ncbi:MAG: phosphate ABC transporter permease PstA [Candidatus Micrarchaeia archaeon]
MICEKTKEKIAFVACSLCAAVVVAALAILIFDIIMNGVGTISWEFITEAPRRSMSEGGIFPALFGTFVISFAAIVLAFPIGVLTAVYLTEYSKEDMFARLINAAIANLAGVPSIVFGLFGFAIFVTFMGFGPSIIAGSLTLALMALPVIIKTSQEAILSVPRDFREASLALGATKWQTVWNHVLPYAMPGILTGTIISLARIAGETAPVLFTVAAYFLPSLPNSLFDQSMVLTYHLYILATQSINLKKTLPLQYGTALVLLMLVLSMNLAAILLRSHYRRRYRW